MIQTIKKFHTYLVVLILKVNSVDIIRNVNGTNKPNSNLHSEIFRLWTFDVYV